MGGGIELLERWVGGRGLLGRGQECGVGGESVVGRGLSEVVVWVG